MEEKERILEKIKALEYKKITEKLEVIYTFLRKKSEKINLQILSLHSPEQIK